MDRSAIRILLVNDKYELRKIVRDYLREDGYTNVIVSENGLSALKKASTDPPDMIIADFDLPGLSGLDLLKAVRQTKDLEEVPFILLSPEPAQKFVALAAEHRVNAYVLKPFSHQTLADKVNFLLSQKISPSTSDQQFKEANRLVQSGNLNTALAMFQEILMTTRKAMAAVNYKIGRIHERMDQNDQATDFYHQAVNYSPTYVDALDALGTLSLKNGQLPAAVDFLQRSTEISPLNAERQFYLGEAYLESGDFSGAEKAYKLALKLDSTRTQIFNRLGISLRRQGKFPEAAEHFLRAIEVEPGDENLYYNLSRVYFDEGKGPEARNYLLKAIKLNPDLKEAQDLLAQLGPAETR